VHKVDKWQHTLEAADVEIINGEGMTDETHQAVTARGAKTKI